MTTATPHPTCKEATKMRIRSLKILLVGVILAIAGCTKPPAMSESLICTGDEIRGTGDIREGTSSPETYSLVISGTDAKTSITLARHGVFFGGIVRDIFDNEDGQKMVTVMDSSIIFIKTTEVDDARDTFTAELLRGTGLMSMDVKSESRLDANSPWTVTERRVFNGVCRPVAPPVLSNGQTG
jgi:hypothetical protein